MRLLPPRLVSLRSLHVTVLALMACLALPAFAQTTDQTPAIEKQMAPEQFKAAGLDKLSSGELANLNAWLNKTIVTETTKAATQATAVATKKVKDDNRGFFNFGSTDPIKSKITGEFRGFAQGRQYTLDNGQVWRQIDNASLAGVRKTAPDVVISPSLVGNAWYFEIKGYGTKAKVIREK